MELFGIIFGLASLGLNAYNAYSGDKAREESLDLAKQQLVQAGIRTEAEKRIAEMQFNNLTSQSFSSAASPQMASGNHVDVLGGLGLKGTNWLLVAAVIAFSVVAFKAVA